MGQRLLVLVSAVLISTAQIHAADTMSPEAKAYLDSALRIMQEHFLHRDRINWQQLRNETIAHAAAAQIALETYPAIRHALAQLGDHHSYLRLTPELLRQVAAQGVPATAPSTARPQTADKPRNPLPSPFRSRRAPEGAMVAFASYPIAQIVIPMFSGPDLDAFATKIQNVIADLAPKKPCGWIVDLRGNGGGNMWPMLAGVGPILGEGEPGGFLNEAGGKGKWFYEKGKAGSRNDRDHPYYARVIGNPVTLPAPPSAAVLIDRDTGSSGEGIAIAFRGRPATRFFGETTYGIATSTFPYTLSDGAQIYLVVGAMVDRRGNDYPSGITPDEEILSDVSISTIDPVIHSASEWLSKQKGCTGS